MSPGPYDAETVRRHLAALDAALQELRQHAGVSAAALGSDIATRWVIERGLQLCAQNVLDIATHLVASAGRDAPDYATAVRLLGDIGVVPADFARTLAGLAGLRNVLVHAYLEVDLGVLHSVLTTRLDDLARFATLVAAYLSPPAP